MRRGVTLIELIFSIVIISIVFSIIPKIIFASNKSMQTSIKEDALFNAYTLLGSISRLAWDESSAEVGDILSVDSLECLESRVGLFIGSRECQVGADANASAIGSFDPNAPLDNIDAYNGYETKTAINANARYKLGVDVRYVDPNYSQAVNTTNLKEINVTVASDSAKTQGFQSSFFYYSANLGNVQIKKEVWR